MYAHTWCHTFMHSASQIQSLSLLTHSHIYSRHSNALSGCRLLIWMSKLQERTDTTVFLQSTRYLNVFEFNFFFFEFEFLCRQRSILIEFTYLSSFSLTSQDFKSFFYRFSTLHVLFAAQYFMYIHFNLQNVNMQTTASLIF